MPFGVRGCGAQEREGGSKDHCCCILQISVRPSDAVQNHHGSHDQTHNHYCEQEVHEHVEPPFLIQSDVHCGCLQFLALQPRLKLGLRAVSTSTCALRISTHCYNWTGPFQQTCDKTMNPAVLRITIQNDQIVDMADIFSIKLLELVVIPNVVYNRLTMWVWGSFKLIDVC